MPEYAWGGAGGGESIGKSGTAGFWIWTPDIGLILHPVPNNYDLKNEKLGASTDMPCTIQMITLSGALERKFVATESFAGSRELTLGSIFSSPLPCGCSSKFIGEELRKLNGRDSGQSFAECEV